jgi:hypothetical protein
LSGLDKTITNAYYVIDLDRKSGLPRSIQMVVLTGSKGETEAKDKKITGGKHVSFRFDYKLSEFGKLKKPAIPTEAQRLLAKG